jgi:hypothetical protein
MLAGWLAESWHPLRKLIVIVDDLGNSLHRTSVLRLNVREPIPEFDWRHEAEQYMADKLLV